MGAQAACQTVNTDVLTKPLVHAPDVDADVRALSRFYWNRGYFDVRVEHRETYSNDRSQVQIDFVINEGGRYKIHHVQIVGNEAISANELRNGIKVRTGDDYDERLVRMDCETIEDQYRRIGAIDPHATSSCTHEATTGSQESSISSSKSERGSTRR